MITLKDVARETGVSAGTVSDILNGRTGVKYGAATVERVRATAERIGYRRNRAASALRRGRSRTAGILVPDLSNPFYAAVLTRVMARLRGEGYGVLVEECLPSTGADGEAEAIRGLVAGRVDGLLALSVQQGNLDALYRELAEDGVAVVATGVVDRGAADSLEIDFRAGCRDLARAVVRLGHRKVVFVGDRPWDFEPGERHDELRAFLEEAGIDGQPERVIHCDHTAAAARDAFRALLKSPGGAEERPTLAVAINDQLALGVLRACRDNRLSVPGDISVVGFDNSPQGALSAVALTSVGPSLRAVADRCSNLLLSRMSGRTGGGPKRLVFEAELHLRETLGPAPKKR